MRWVICAVVVLAFAQSAFADDLDILRGTQTVGPPTFTNWSGFYFGGQIGYSSTNADFSNATVAPIAYDLRELGLENAFTPSPSTWPVLGSAEDSRMAYGGFVGYNTQWEDLILGLEADYNQASFSLIAPNSPISRYIIPPPNPPTPCPFNVNLPASCGNTYLVNTSGSGSVTNLDYGTLRARAGWVFGNFLPYGFAGVALGRANIATSATVSGTQNPPVTGTCAVASPPTCSSSNFFYTSSNTGWAFMYGFAVGGGMDIALTQNIFLRGEYEYVQFANVSGVAVAISSARVGAGIKF